MGSATRMPLSTSHAGHFHFALPVNISRTLAAMNGILFSGVAQCESLFRYRLISICSVLGSVISEQNATLLQGKNECFSPLTKRYLVCIDINISNTTAHRVILIAMISMPLISVLRGVADYFQYRPIHKVLYRAGHVNYDSRVDVALHLLIFLLFIMAIYAVRFFL